MDRIQHTTAAASLPVTTGTGTIGYFHPGVPGITPRTIVTAHWANRVQEELVHLIEAAGLTPSDAEMDQVERGVVRVPISARYTHSGSQALNPAIQNIVDFDLKNWDAPGADRVTTGAVWHFTADREGLYTVHCGLVVEHDGINDRDWIKLVLQADTAVPWFDYAVLDWQVYDLPSSYVGTLHRHVGGSTMVRLGAGHSLRVVVEYALGGGAARINDSVESHISILEGGAF